MPTCLIDEWAGEARLSEHLPEKLSDLFPPDCFLWGVLKEKVYSAKPRDISELKKQNRAAIAQVPLDLCAKVCCSVPERLTKRIELYESTWSFNKYHVLCYNKL